VDLRDVLRAVRRLWFVVVLSLIAVSVLAAVLAVRTEPRYATTARGVVTVTDPETRPPSVLASSSQYILARLTSYARLAASSRVLDPVAAELGLDRAGHDLRREVTAQNEVETAFIDVTVEERDPALAARIADATVRQLAATVTDLEGGTIRVTPTGPAPVPTAASNRHLTLDIGLGAVAGLLLGTLLAALADLILPASGRHA
jgi:capsular polysaccharide biosynthesis protein